MVTRPSRRSCCFWFTGPSGAGIRKAVEALQQESEGRGRKAIVVDLEDEVWNGYVRDHALDVSLHKDERGTFKQLLDEPPNYVQEIWRKAVRTSISRVNRILDAGDDVFLTFHCVYHTDKFGDFYSPVDAQILQQLPPPKRFLTLIDDIGDVAGRLRRSGHIFSTRQQVGFPSVRAAIRDLLTILEWRTAEFAVSRLLGGVVKSPAFLLAVKHPVVSAARLIYNEGSPAYISHSISDSRRYAKRTGSWPSFMHDVQNFTDTLVSNRGERDAIPIVPTAIDELRLNRSGIIEGQFM
jgi:hypothetical protein